MDCDRGCDRTRARGAGVLRLAGNRAAAHIPQRFAAEVNIFCSTCLNPYLNFHRPCFFAVEAADAKGTIRRRYPKDQIMTPFEKLQSLPTAASYLKPDITLFALEQTARKMSDNDAAQRLNIARTQLFQSIHRRSKHAA